MDVEKEYIRKIASGDRSAFDALFLLYYPRIKNFIIGFLKSEEDAFDLAQDIFLKIWDNREKLPEIDNIKTYLFQMSKNAVFDFFRRSTLFDQYSSAKKHKLIEGETISPEGVLEAKELEMLIYGLIEQMPSQRKTVFKMSRQEGLSNDEIAEKLNLSKRTVETHISNVLKEIRKFLTSITLFFL